jgi:prepilin-type N-terminal cleavage/methylation domain-containing protein
MRIENLKLKISSGFTLLELIVVISITGILAAMVTANFLRIRTAQEIQNAANDMTSKVRGIQNAVLSGGLVNNPGTGTKTGADAYDMVFTANTQQYTIDYIFNNPNSTSTSAETMSLPVNVKINNITVNGVDLTPVRIRMSAPFGEVSISGAINRVVQINLTHLKTGLNKAVIIDGISGRIAVQ